VAAQARQAARGAKDGLEILWSRAAQFFASRTEALVAARAILAGITNKDFARTIALAHDIANEYGVRWAGAGWYLKLTIDETVPEVVVISLHPLEHPLRTNRGHG